MRILINLLNFRPGKIGGTETYLRELVAHLPDVVRHERIVLLTSRDTAVEGLPDLTDHNKIVQGALA